MLVNQNNNFVQVWESFFLRDQRNFINLYLKWKDYTQKSTQKVGTQENHGHIEVPTWRWAMCPERKTLRPWQGLCNLNNVESCVRIILRKQSLCLGGFFSGSSMCVRVGSGRRDRPGEPSQHLCGASSCHAYSKVAQGKGRKQGSSE